MVWLTQNTVELGYYFYTDFKCENWMQCNTKHLPPLVLYWIRVNHRPKHCCRANDLGLTNEKQAGLESWKIATSHQQNRRDRGGMAWFVHLQWLLTTRVISISWHISTCHYFGLEWTGSGIRRLAFLILPTKLWLPWWFVQVGRLM